MVRRWLWLPAVAVLVAGCSGGGSHPAAKPTAGWVRSDLKPVTQPELAGGLLVLYAEAGGGLQVDALDPKTGKTVWHDSASPGHTTPGVVPVLGVVGSIVAFLRPVDNSAGTAQMVGVDAATGRQRWHTPVLIFTDWPAPCPDSPADICTTVSVENPGTLAVRVRAGDGAPAGSALIGLSPGGRSLGPDLFSPSTRNPELLLAVSGASVAWTETLASVLPARGLSSDNGWDFDRVPAAGLFVGSVAGPLVSSTRSSRTFDLSRSMTAGFRISDGTAVWRDPGTLYACGQPLPCPGGARMVEENQAYRPPTTGLRLRATGTVTASASSTKPKLSQDTDVVLEGFDLATGKTLWSYNAGPDVFLFGQTPPLLQANVVVLPAPGGGMVAVNLVTGAHKPDQIGAAAWCQAPIIYKTQVKYIYHTGSASYGRIGQEAIKPCKASGAPAVPPPTVPGFVGTVVGGFTVWGESSEVVAAPTSS